MKEYAEDPLTKIYREKAGNRSRFEEARKKFDEDPLVLDEFLAECFLYKRCPHCGSEVGELDAIRFNGFSEESHRKTFYREAMARDTSISPATALSYAGWQAARDGAIRAIGQAADRDEMKTAEGRQDEPADESADDTMQTT